MGVCKLETPFNINTPCGHIKDYESNTNEYEFDFEYLIP